MEDEHFKTADLAFAAFLKIADVPFLGTEKKDRQTIFIFERVEGIRDLKNDFFSRKKVQMSPLSYHDELKALKNLLHMD